jgi:hypothetical protein
MEDGIQIKEKKPKRPRINANEKKGIPAIADSEEFVQNKCSKNARKIHNHDLNTNVDFWIDKHYHIRNQIGDENGKREGIEPDKILPLVKESIPHIMLYCSFIKNFVFLNHDNMPNPGRRTRVVCRKEFDGKWSNVAIEGHVLSLNEIEITIVTAIQADEFQTSDNQYTIELNGIGGSDLYYCSNGKQGIAGTINQ